jgi:hypothetical protein
MTDHVKSRDFLMGASMLINYATEETSIDVAEQSAIVISGLRVISYKEDLTLLKSWGWEIGKDKEGGSWAQYFGLEYVDT